MNQLTQLKYRISLIGLILSGVVLTGCQQEGSTLKHLTNEEELPTVIHVDSQAKTTALTLSKQTTNTQELIRKICNDENSTPLVQFLNQVNESILSFLAEQKVMISIEPTLEIYHSGYSEQYGEVAGVYLPDTNQIIFREQSEEDLQELLDQQFYHEVGHVVDTLLGDLAMTEEFQLLYQEGAEIIFSEHDLINQYYRENVWEYFAESFNLFFKNPAQLTRHEATYKYICSIVEQLQST